MPRERAPRLVALDAFRGLDVLLMIFVNAIAGMPGTPWWLQHAETKADFYTLTDLVFPAFLFIVGFAIPLAVRARRERGEGVPVLLGHAVLRTAGLLVLGVLFVNQGRFSDEHTGLTERAWMGLALAAAVVLLASPPPPGSRWRAPWLLGRAAAGALLAWLLWRYRGIEDGRVVRLEPQWWGILGIIGWCYFAGIVICLLAGGGTAALTGTTGFFVALHLGQGREVVSFPFPLSEVSWSLTAVVTAGMACGSLFTDERGTASRGRYLLVFGLGLLAAGYLLRPLHGFSKNRGTESWALASAGWSCLTFLAVWLATDVAGRPGWLRFTLPAGRNALLAYVLPDLAGALCGLAGLDLMPWWGRGGAWGMANAAGFTALMLALTAGLTRLGVVLRL